MSLPAVDLRHTALAIAAWVLVAAGPLGAQPNPYRMVESWAKLPPGRTMGAVGDLAPDPDGKHLWVIMRCEDAGKFGSECLDSNLDPILKFDLAGNVVKTFGGGRFIWPHGLDVDREGNVWVTDAVNPKRTPIGSRGHQVIKFSPEGQVLLVLGTPGVPGGNVARISASAGLAGSSTEEMSRPRPASRPTTWRRFAPTSMPRPAHGRIIGF